MKIKLYNNDLPNNVKFTKSVAIDTETMGLNPLRDRLCLAQLSNGTGVCHLVKFESNPPKPKNLISILKNKKIIEKLFTNIVKRYETRKGGHTRILKNGFRYGDMAPLAVIELVDRDEKVKGLDSGPVQKKHDNETKSDEKSSDSSQQNPDQNIDKKISENELKDNKKNEEKSEEKTKK